MHTGQNAFGEYLKHLIKTAGMTHVSFYTELDIGKPYFYDVLSGRLNAFPPHLQFKAMEILKADKQTRSRFFDMSADLRGEMPADIKVIIDKDPTLINEIRLLLHKLLAAQEENV